MYRASSLANDEDRALLLAHPELLDFGAEPVLEGRVTVAVATGSWGEIGGASVAGSECVAGSDRAAGGAVVGFGSWSAVGPMLELEDLFVMPAWMHRGVGRQLVEALVTTAGQLGMRGIEVTGHVAAEKFYTAMGFELIGTVAVQFGTAPRLRRDLPAL